MTPEAQAALAERNIYVYVIITLVTAVVALFGSLLWQVRKTTDIQDKRIEDRDRFQTAQTLLARGTADVVEKNTQGLFTFTRELADLRKEVEEFKPRRSKPGQGAG
jgi:hypothetical protein